MHYVATLKSNNEILLRGDLCILNIPQLYKAVVDPACVSIDITKEFATEFFTAEGIQEFVETAASLSPWITVVVEDYSYDDTLESVQHYTKYRTREEIIFELQYNPERFIRTLNELCTNYLGVRDDSIRTSNKIADLLMKNSDLETELSEQAISTTDMQERCNDMESKLRVLVNRMQFRYNKHVDLQEMECLRENGYKKVLYIKELSRVKYTDTMLYYLQEILKTLYNEPVRTVILAPFYSHKSARLYPRYKPHWELTYRDVMCEDVYMAGLQPNLMSDILKDGNHSSYLIILDRSCCDAPFVTGKNVETVYITSDINDLEPQIPLEQVISYESNTMNIQHIVDFSTKSPELCIQDYSNMEVIKNLIELIERR